MFPPFGQNQNRNDDKRMMEIYDEMEKLESAVSELTKLKHGSHSADDYLMHYGVRGMKWGVRKTPEQLGYRPTRRTASEKSVLGKSTKIARRLATSSGSKIREKVNDPEFQRKVATGAKIALAIGVMYASHKLVNNPQAIQAGKNLISGVLGANGHMKAAMLNSTEFKVAKASLGVAKKGLQVVGSENVRNTVTGIGAMATTAAVLKSQIKDLKENKPEGDSVDKALEYTKKMTAIGENVNSLARGTSGTAGSNSSSNSKGQSNGKSVGKDVTDRIGKPSNKGIDKSSSEYQNLFKNRDAEARSTIKSLANAGYDIDQIKKYLEHSAFNSSFYRGWSFNPMAGCRYIF